MHDTPQYNGVAESLNHCLMEGVCAFLIQAALLKSLWAEVARFVIWLKNRSIMCVLGDATPHECLMGHKPNLAGLLEWGQCVWVHAGKSSKLGKHATLMHWISYDKGSPHAHRIYWPEMQSVTMERNVQFTADFTTVYTLPGPVHNPLPTSLVQTTPPPWAQPLAPQTPPTSLPEQMQPPPATSSGKEEVKVKVKLDEDEPPSV
jgi:hypothetical protein